MLTLSSSLPGQSSFCAFEVNVRFPNGRPAARIPVATVEDGKQEISEAVTDKNGVARICDAPLEAVDIAVGQDVCGLILVQRVRQTWPQTHRIFVTYAPNPCYHMGISPQCQVLLRIKDESGRPISGVLLEGITSARGSKVSDDLGRYFLIVKRGEKVRGVLHKDGYRESEFAEVCSDDIERKVTLSKE
jgi:hypothetical protein